MCISAARFTLLLSLFSFTLALSPSVNAHPLDEANLYHFFTCKLSSNSLSIDYRVMVGGLVVSKAWNEVDADRNHMISSGEQAVFNRRVASRLELTLNGKPLQLKIISSRLPEYDDFVAGTVPYLQFNLMAGLPPNLKGEHEIRLVNENYSGYSNLYPEAEVVSPPNQKTDIRTVEREKGFRITIHSQSSGASSEISVVKPGNKPEAPKPGHRSQGYLKPVNLGGGTLVIILIVALALWRRAYINMRTE